MIISSAAHFKTCSCGEHGHIRFADGTDSLEACDKETALAAMQDGVKEGKVTKEEVMILREQIQSSRLPKTWRDVDALLGFVIELSNQSRCDHQRHIDELVRRLSGPGRPISFN